MAAIEPGTTPAPADAPVSAPDFSDAPEFKSVREAQAYAREHNATPDLNTIPDEPVAPAAPADAPDDYSDLVPPVTGEVVPPAAAPGTPAPEGTDPYAQWGGRQAVEDAVVVANALKSEQGVRAVVAQGLTALGFQPEAVQQFLASKEGQAAVAAGASVVPAAAPADPWADIADDDVVDGSTVKAMLAQLGKQITEQVLAGQAEATKPLQQQIAEDRQRNASAAVDSVLTEVLKIDPATGPTDLQKSQIGDIQAFASKYLDPNSWDPNHIANAIRRGYLDMEARDEARFQQRVAAKRAAHAAVPTNIGGGVPGGGEPVREPQSAKEAAQMRKALGL